VRFNVTRRPDPLVDVTPMIDIVFQLVLFFMVSTTFITSPGIQVDLPRSTQEMVMADKEDINVWMTVEGAVYVNEKAVTSERLTAIFKKAAKRNPDSLVVIKADVGVTHGRVVAVMDLARNEGLVRLAIATEAGPDTLNANE